MPLAQRESVEWEPAGFPTVIWFDPGGTTGWAVFTVHPDALDCDDFAVLDNIVHWDQGQIGGSEMEQIDAITELLELWDGAAVGCEDFELRTVYAELTPVTIRSKMEYVLQRMFDPPRPMMLQMPSLAMTSVTDDRLKRWKLYRPGQVHGRDATKHCMTFLRRAKKDEGIRRAAWPHLYT